MAATTTYRTATDTDNRPRAGLTKMLTYAIATVDVSVLHTARIRAAAQGGLGPESARRDGAQSSAEPSLGEMAAAQQLLQFLCTTVT